MDYRKDIMARLMGKLSMYRSPKTIEGEITDPETGTIYAYQFIVGKPSKSSYIKPTGDGWNEPREEGYWETEGSNLEPDGIYIMVNEEPVNEVTDPIVIQKVIDLVLGSGQHEDEIMEIEQELAEENRPFREPEPDDSYDYY